ncbi:MAG TPA: alpha-hydroxy-acid oxidizing protein, partial [Polyangiaceae bacterium]|nr:alpha-hydroxy-acid oxidizing protein [Polyangiaceae bacterium]
LIEQGICNVDVSGAGGTSWVAVEYHRTSEARRELAKTFWDWGIPTAASVAMCVSQGMKIVFATGGVTSGLDAARAIVLGASAVGIARPLLRVLASEGRAGASAFMERIETELRMAMLLVGAADLEALRRCPKVIADPLRTWLQFGPAS